MNTTNEVFTSQGYILDYSKGLEDGRTKGRIDASNLLPLNEIKENNNFPKSYISGYNKGYNESYYFTYKLLANKELLEIRKCK